MNSNTQTAIPGPFLSENSGCQSPMVSICAIQPQLRPDTQTPAQAVEHAIDLMHRAHRGSDGNDSRHQNGTASNIHIDNDIEKIDLYILPELSPIGYSEDTFAHYLPDTPTKQQIYKELDARMAETAQRLNAYICYGTIGWHSKSPPQHEENDNNKTSYNNNNNKQSFDFTIRQVVVEPSTGQQLAVYDKMYLCDYGDCAETRFFVPSPSQQPVSFAIGSFRLGLMICADQRVPTLARTYAASPAHNVDILLQPAAFVRDVSFATWKSFRETRAVENSCYFLGINYCGNAYGETTLVPPWVDDSGTTDSTARSLGCDESWLVCYIQRSVLQRVRTTFPFYRILKAEAGRDS